MFNKLNLFFLITFFILSCSRIYAFTPFIDNFQYKDVAKWNYNENGGSILYDNGILSLGSYSGTFPLMVRSFPDGVFSKNTDSTIEFKFSYNSISYGGDGIGIGFTGFNGRPFYQFQIWADAAHGKAYFSSSDYSTNIYNNCTFFYDQSYFSLYQEVNLSNDSNWHVLRIEKKGNSLSDTRYYVYLDKEINTQPIYISGLKQCQPNYVWIGNPLTGASSWSAFSLDYFSAFAGTGAVQLEPTSTPKPKTILIPGLGASWNTEAMVYGKTIADKDWKMTPFVKNYDNLIKAFKNNGLTEGEDFFVWNYDWRRPISEIVNSLNEFINQKIGSGEKLNLVGHSLGAVTARIWAQEHSGDFRIGKVVGLGGPQFGSIEAYDTWNGAKLGDSLDFHKIALNLVSVLNERESVKEFAPVLKDLVPIFDFIYKNPTVRNNYLNSKNIGFDNMISYIGSGEKTKRYIEEKKYLYGDGDGTVLINSASVGELNIAPSNHGDIVDKNINGILNNLDLGTTLSNYNFNNSLKNKLLFFIGSPAKFQVKCDGKIMGNNDELGFLIVDGKNLRGCTVKLTGTGNGKYHLVTAKIGDGESWHYYENYIKLGQIKNIQIDARDGHQENENECRDRKF